MDTFGSKHFPWPAAVPGLLAAAALAFLAESPYGFAAAALISLLILGGGLWVENIERRNEAAMRCDLRRPGVRVGSGRDGNNRKRNGFAGTTP